MGINDRKFDGVGGGGNPCVRELKEESPRSRARGRTVQTLRVGKTTQSSAGLMRPRARQEAGVVLAHTSGLGAHGRAVHGRGGGRGALAGTVCSSVRVFTTSG